MSHQGTDLPNVDAEQFKVPAIGDFSKIGVSTHRPRFLLLYGSVRERSYSRSLTMEAARLLEAMGGEVKIFAPRGLPLPDSEPETHPKVVELRELANWSEGRGVMLARASWRHDRHHEGPNRLDPVVSRGRSPFARQDLGRHSFG